jgi:hypothetical protein
MQMIYGFMANSTYASQVLNPTLDWNEGQYKKDLILSLHCPLNKTDKCHSLKIKHTVF